ncbi:MAG: oligosaccharide flippase family protein [Planctomycetota bacterium]|jgi:PST family polysaccharide transporter
MKERAIRGSIWLAGARAIQVAAQFGSLLVLARYLDKEAFGLAGMTMVLLAVFGAGADLGMGVIGVQRSEPDERRIATLSLASGALLAALLALLAPWGARLFGEGEALVDLLRAGSPALLCAGLMASARARLARRLAFERIAGLDAEIALVAAAGRIGFAMQGFGAWSLVLGDLLGVALGTVGFWLVAPRPHPGTAQPLVGDGLHVVGARLADVLFGQIDRFYVAVRFGAGALGLYTFAYPHAMTVARHGGPIAEQVALPWFSRLAEEDRDSPGHPRVANAYVSVTRVYALAALPFATAIWVLAPWLLDTLYPERWQEAVPVVRALCVAAFCAGLNSDPGLVWLALGRVRLRMVWSVVNVTLLAIALPVFAGDWLLAVPYALAARSLLATVCAQAITRRLTGLPHRLYFFALVPGLIASMGILTIALLAR